jgi:hypothetical protein
MFVKREASVLVYTAKACILTNAEVSEAGVLRQGHFILSLHSEGLWFNSITYETNAIHRRFSSVEGQIKRNEFHVSSHTSLLLDNKDVGLEFA